ncbi:hypothetical protein L2X99_09270 [Microbacterium sp. KUDC0406]|uniref:hypothetical protein n=1 Tax=Microbacterium sp. KUDC0406 TaxID=2909588 RepID=UPI001F17821E|nr:hypothetical protein [Microbacterium sp. KUDC0406]UJP08714.1 hypothetical protein L2X99_09270 [Microbacterium sp. KUDC0406]
MTMTTIKVSSELRDRLKEQARAENRTMGEQLAFLVDAHRRERDFEAMREAMSRMTPEDWADYHEETAWWDAAQGPIQD